MSGLRRIFRQRWAQKALAVAGAEYLRLVFATNRRVIPPEELYAVVDPHLPVILAMWHGQHFLAPFLKRPGDRIKVLISHHRDGEVNALSAERLGIEVIRGSGDPGGRFDRNSLSVPELVAANSGPALCTSCCIDCGVRRWICAAGPAR